MRLPANVLEHHPFPMERRAPLSETAVALFGWRYLELVHRALAGAMPVPVTAVSWRVEPEGAHGGPELVASYQPQGLGHAVRLLDSATWDSIAFRGAAFPALYRTNPGA